jgi:cystathionine beta-synthase
VRGARRFGIISAMATDTSTGQEIKASILETIGDTPLVRLSRIEPALKCQLVAKVESFNPGGSIKDRVALRMIEAAERDGRLKPGGTIIEPTSGNTGTGLAIAARLRGYRVIAVMPDKMSREKIDLLRAYGAEVIVCPTNVDPESPESYYSVSDRLSREIPGAFKPDQYSNPANPQTHYETTGPEIWRQTGGRITHLVVGVGTGGTITGCARYLKERNPDLVVVGADPVGSIYSNDDVKPYLVEGVGEDFWPQTYDPSVTDRYVTVSDKDSFLTTRALARTEGLLVGGSCGMAVHAALEVARDITDPNALVVVILPDGGRAYLSKIFNDGWMAQHGFLPRTGERTAGEVLVDKHGVGAIPPLVSVETQQKVRDAVALLHEHQVSQLPVVSSHDRESIVGSVGERGLLKRAIDDAAVLDEDVVDVMEPPFPSVSVSDSVRDAVELLSGERQALTVTEHGRPIGILTRSDLLESLASSGQPATM